MNRLSLLVIAAACATACGGASKPPPTAPLPDDTKQAPPPPPAETKPPPAPAAEAKPAPPPGPIEIKIPPRDTTVKLVSGGKGKKAALRYSAKPGTKQAVELAIDFAGKQDTEEQVVPTIVLFGDAEIKGIDKGGNAEYTMTVTGTDAREVAGSNAPLDKFKEVLTSLSGLTIDGTLGPSGVAGEVTLRMAHPPVHATEALELIRVTLPTLPVLPTEALGVGAKWQSTTSAKLADRLAVTQVTDYEVVAHKGASWTIKGTTKVTGADQEIEDSKISQITGTGTSETTITDGALYPAHKSSVETTFKASEKDKSAQFAIKVGGAVTPKTP
ncbi:MAG TPA: hypothetical protein VFT22_24220 [Kofleriaceae bacterium]|nr:hypothetical protein [Kofleriaceae bacterium]